MPLPGPRFTYKYVRVHEPRINTRKSDVWRTPDYQPLCFHCGEAGHLYRACYYRRIGLQGYHPGARRHVRESVREKSSNIWPVNLRRRTRSSHRLNSPCQRPDLRLRRGASHDHHLLDDRRHLAATLRSPLPWATGPRAQVGETENSDLRRWGRCPTHFERSSAATPRRRR